MTDDQDRDEPMSVEDEAKLRTALLAVHTALAVSDDLVAQSWPAYDLAAALEFSQRPAGLVGGGAELGGDIQHGERDA